MSCEAIHDTLQFLEEIGKDKLYSQYDLTSNEFVSIYNLSIMQRFGYKNTLFKFYNDKFVYFNCFVITHRKISKFNIKNLMNYFENIEDEIAYMFVIIKLPGLRAHCVCLFWNNKKRTLQYYDCNILTCDKIFINRMNKFFGHIKDLYPDVKIINSKQLHINAEIMDLNDKSPHETLNSYFSEKHGHGGCIFISWLIVYLRIKYPQEKLCNIIKQIHKYSNIENTSNIIKGIKFILDSHLYFRSDIECFDVLDQLAFI